MRLQLLEGLEANEEEVNGEYARIADLYKMDVEKVKSLISADNIAYDFSLRRANTLILDSVK